MPFYSDIAAASDGDFKCGVISAAKVAFAHDEEIAFEILESCGVVWSDFDSVEQTEHLATSYRDKLARVAQAHKEREQELSDALTRLAKAD